MINLIGYKNGSYTIIAQGRMTVVGVKKSDMSPTNAEYVTWSYHTLADGTPDFYWGTYTTSLEDVLLKFNEKEIN